MNAKKVLFITPQPFLADRGSPLRVKSTLEALSGLGYKVDLLALPFGTEVEIPGVDIFRSKKWPNILDVPIGPSWVKLWLGMLQAGSALHLVLKNKYDAIHGVEEAAFIAATLGRLFKIPYIVDRHSAMVDQLQDLEFVRGNFLLRAFDWLERWGMRGAAGVMTVSDELTKRAEEVAENVKVVTATDLPLDSVSEVNIEAVERLRKNYGLEGKRVVLYAGNLHYYQGIELLVRGFSEALKSDAVKDIALVILGGKLGVDADRETYARLAAELGIGDNVRFIQPHAASEMGNFFALADVLVSPRLTGCNTPLKIYSYLAARKPVVATRIQSHTQVLDDSVCFLCDPSPECIGASLASAVSSDPQVIERRLELVEAAKTLVDTKYSKGQFRKAISELYLAVEKRDTDRYMFCGGVMLPYVFTLLSFT